MRLNLIHSISFLFIVCLSFQSPNLMAQDEKVIVPRLKASPLAMASYLSDDNTYIKITYGQPFKKDRQIFGGLVPYGQIWRLGANEATEITLTKDIKIARKLLKAGSYTLFAVPDEDRWTIIFNGVLGQWGAYKYEENKGENVLSFTVQTQESEAIYEALTMMFEQTRKGAELIIYWAQTKVVIPIDFQD